MKTKKLLALVLSLLMMLSLCACGRSQSAAPTYAGGAREESAAYFPAPAEAPMAAYDMAAYEDEGLGLAGNAAAAKAEGGGEAPTENPEKIIYSADATVETTEFDECLTALEQLLAANGGFVESSSVNGSNYYDSARGKVSRRTASYTLRIPSAKFGGMMDALSTLGNVPYTHMYTENVTAQYYDVEARMKAYQKQEARLMEMMELAETVEDIIILEDRLTEIRYQIESLQSSLNNWDRQVSYSTVYLDLIEVQEYSPEPQVQPSFGQKLRTALKDGLHGAGTFFSELLLFLAEALPTLLILAAVALAVILPLRKSRKKRRAKKAAPAPAPAAAPAEEERP